MLIVIKFKMCHTFGVFRAISYECGLLHSDI